MSANWSRSRTRNAWVHLTGGIAQIVECDDEGWIDIKDHRPELFIRVQVYGQHIFASTAVQAKADYDSLRCDDAGEHWGSNRNVTHWQPETDPPRPIL